MWNILRENKQLLQPTLGKRLQNPYTSESHEGLVQIYFLFQMGVILRFQPSIFGFVPIQRFNGYVLWGTVCLSIFTLMLDTKVTTLMLWERLCCLSSKRVSYLRILSRTCAVQLSLRDTSTSLYPQRF